MACRCASPSVSNNASSRPGKDPLPLPHGPDRHIPQRQQRCVPGSSGRKSRGSLGSGRQAQPRHHKGRRATHRSWCSRSCTHARRAGRWAGGERGRGQEVCDEQGRVQTERHTAGQPEAGRAATPLAQAQLPRQGQHLSLNCSLSRRQAVGAGVLFLLAGPRGPQLVRPGRIHSPGPGGPAHQPWNQPTPEAYMLCVTHRGAATHFGAV